MKTKWPVFRHATILTACAAFCVGPAGAQNAASGGVTQPVSARAASLATAASLITRVEVNQEDGCTIVRVAGNGALVYQAAHLNNPERLVLDFSGVRFAASSHAALSPVSPVERIRVGQFKSDVARVVIDLSSAVPYSVRTQGTALLVTFTAAASGPATVSKGVAPASRPVHRRAELAAPRATTLKEVSRLPLPDYLTQPAFLASPKPPSLPAQDPPPPQPQPQQPVALQHVAAATASPSGQKYTGEPISVNFKDLDLKDFFRLIHEISGLNVVLDPAVKGSLPALVLDDVPWDQALDIVLRNNQLDKELDGNVLRIATQDTIKSELEKARDLAKAQEASIEPVTTTRVLSYTKASTLRETLRRWLSPRGEILADDRTNTLIIMDIPSVLPSIDNLIRQLDRKSQQVEIEARVVAASRSFSRDIGSQFGFATSSTSGRTIFGGVSTVGTSPIIRGLVPIPPLVNGGAVLGGGGAQLPLNTNLGAGTPTSGVSFAHSSPNFAVDYIITAAETKGVGKLLSKPKIYTQNNEKGTVKQGTKIPLQTTINNTISVQYVDAVLKLEVTPQITADGTIFMQVLVENTQIDNGIPRVMGVPALDTESVETSVLVSDGGTVVIGGVTISSQQTNINEVPLVGSIPIIGNLFKRTTTSVQSQDLYFFLTPRVLAD